MANAKESMDFSSLFRVVQEVLKRTTSVAAKCLLGKNEPITTPGSEVTVSSINCPLKALTRIHCAVARGADSEPNVSDSVIKLLSTYSWAEKAVLTLAAFALSYGELLFYVDHGNLNTFATLLSSLRRVDEIIRVKEEEQFKTAIIELNAVTNQSVDFIDHILELENLSKKDGIDRSSVAEIMTTVRHSSSLAIGFVVKCLTLVNYLTYEYDRIKTAKGLSSLAASLESELETLKQIVDKYKSRIGEWEVYSKLHDCICRGLGIVEVMTYMMYPSLEPYLDRCKEGVVKVDQALKGNNVLLFISRIDNLSEADFSALETVHKMLEKELRNYKIVWIPVLEGVKELQKLDEWKKRMPWYVASYEASKPIIGIRYIKERWQFSYNPMVVVLNHNGAVVCPDAMHMIRAWGFSAFPFIPQRLPSAPGVGPIIFPIIDGDQIKEEEYIFLCGGGKDQAWISVFGEHVRKLAADDLVRQKISLKPYPIGEKNASIEVQFWTRVESMLCARMQYWNTSDHGTAKQIRKLLSLKQDESGWAMLCKGSTNVLVCTSGTLISEAVSKYQDWVKNMDKKKFEGCLLDYLETLIKRSDKPRTCCHVPFHSLSGWIPGEVECPDCGARMERIVTYKCCHSENTNK